MRATRDGAVIFWQIDRNKQGTHRQGDAVQSRRRASHQGRTDIGSELDTQHIEKATDIAGGVAAIPMPLRRTSAKQ